MKSTLARIVPALALAAIAFCPSTSHAQQQGPIPVVITPRQLQYKVVDTARIVPGANQSVAGTIENILNEAAAQGWKLVSISGSLIILSR